VTSLLAEVRQLAAATRRAVGDGPAAAAVDEIVARLDQPLRVAFAGRVKAGKSTLLNALVGEQLAPTDAGECTRIVTWYRDGHTPRVVLNLRSGATRQAGFTREDGALVVDLGGETSEEIDRIDVHWPTSRLAAVTLIDTPGLGSATEGGSAPTMRFLAIDDDAEGHSEADAVIYLMRHLHQSDLGFLEAFHDGSVSAASAVNTIAVLSRADEVGACRPEAMQTARRIAARYRSEPRIRRLSQTVVPVSGLLAEAAMTLTEAEYRALATIAALPRADADALLLTVDRFVAEGATDVTPIEREGLLERFGLYGVRSSVRLIRLGGATSATELANELRAVSGIEELRGLLATLFTQRRDVLKARAALSALESVLRQHGDPDGLLAEHERVVASAHELTELQIIAAIRGGRVPLQMTEVEEIERLLDQPGATLAERLGSTDGAERAALLAAVDRWRRRSEHPLSSRAVVETSSAVVRTLEGLLQELSAGAH
jgi:hypothetical protein